ncbi:MAG: ester cyclase [Micromonosporaceae bacterium]
MSSAPRSACSAWPSSCTPPDPRDPARPARHASEDRAEQASRAPTCGRVAERRPSRGAGRTHHPRLSAAARRWIEPFLGSFTDVSMRIVELVAEDDTVVARFACSGTHTGSWLGHPPTGRRFTAIADGLRLPIHRQPHRPRLEPRGHPHSPSAARPGQPPTDLTTPPAMPSTRELRDVGANRPAQRCNASVRTSATPARPTWTPRPSPQRPRGQDRCRPGPCCPGT